jgi:hypothetical protein
MVAKITTPYSILRVLNYNEKKVKKAQAECIGAGNFLLDPKDMTFYDKLDTFRNRIELNARAKTNTMHISLNFDPSENLSKEKLTEIASEYMNKIGFGRQPYLVYQHRDAGHPHIHIVTVTIQENGKRINTYNIGRNQSEKARKEIEGSFGLIKASGRDFRKVEGIEPVKAQKVKYGLSETKRSIINVLDAVIDKYKYTSLPELNVILKQYNVMADRGREEGRIYRHRGLTYRVLDANGDKVGVPIKASSIYSKPTLDYLEEKFKKNKGLREPYKRQLQNAIEWTLRKKPENFGEFLSQIQKEKVTGIARRNEDGFMYGITFIDHRSKCVFNGSDIGKSYSATSLQEMIEKGLIEKANALAGLLKKQPVSTNLLPMENNKDLQENKDKSQFEKAVSRRSDALDILLSAGKDHSRIPYELIRKKKKRRKPGL